MAGFKGYPVFVNGVMTGTSTIRSTPLKICGRKCSFQAAWTGTPTGSSTSNGWVIKGSNDYNPELTTGGDPTTGGTWSDVGATIPSAAKPAGSASNAKFDVDIADAWVMFEYTNASGTGVLNAKVSTVDP